MNAVKIAKWNITFVVGEIYQNYLGCYCVVSIHDDAKMMDIEYRSGERIGQKQTLEIAGQAKVIHNARIRELQSMKMREINLHGANESFTLGYLAHHGVICIRVKECRQKWFEDTYKRLTGLVAPEPNVEGNWYTVSPDTTEGSWDYFHVIFPAPDDCFKGLMVFSGDPDRQIMWDQWGVNSKYNDRNYVQNLFSLGFRLGKQHDVAGIRAKLAEDIANFDKGYNCEPASKELLIVPA